MKERKKLVGVPWKGKVSYKGRNILERILYR